MNSMVRFISVYVLFAAAGLIITFHQDTIVPINKPFSEFPTEVNSWKLLNRSEFSAQVLNVLKASDYLSSQFIGADGKSVGLYIGYHSGGKDSGGIHSPKHCLPGSGWYEVSSNKNILTTQNGTINLVRAVYQKGDSKELFLYWFQVRDRSISNEYSLKIAEIMNSALYRRRDSSFIRVSVPVESDIEHAITKGERFIRDFEPQFKAFLPR